MGRRKVVVFTAVLDKGVMQYFPVNGVFVCESDTDVIDAEDTFNMNLKDYKGRVVNVSKAFVDMACVFDVLDLNVFLEAVRALTSDCFQVSNMDFGKDYQGRTVFKDLAEHYRTVEKLADDLKFLVV